MSKELTEQQQKHREKRKKLKELSIKAREIIAFEKLETSINFIIIDRFYKDEENFEFNTLHQWGKLGFKVKKGSISFVVWGRPKSKQDAEVNPEVSEEDTKDDFYPLCYLFSNAQVEKRITTE